MGIGVRNVLTRRKGVKGFGSALMRCKLAWDGARRFGIGKSGSGMVLIAKASTQIMVPIITVLDMSTPEVVATPPGTTGWLTGNNSTLPLAKN